MDKLVLEIPSINRKDDALDFVKEFFAYNSKINGTGGLQRYVDSYEDWLLKLADDCSFTKERVPARTLFLVREKDCKIVGIINIRLALNERLRNTAGNIGYSIRPTERNKGYSKVGLYLALKECTKHNMEEVLLSCNRKNIASSKTILALGGKFEREIFDEENDDYLDFYTINVKESVEKHKDLYEKNR